MNKYFIKNQLIITLFFAALSAYLIKNYIDNSENLNHNNKKEIVISEKNCGIHNGAYSISFLYNDKRYNSKILGDQCLDLKIGDKYELFYFKKNDEFVDYHSFKHSKKGIIFSVIIFILSLMPYKYIFIKK
ncbi:hypothetical protein SAMN05421738_102157 [Algoriella xinjiangensis]|uniref:DUF3592 domain-containing protein n=1 Tax=Algoriella xinjiangensis TaxID=684065 RepID=A0A1I4TDF9_9FLAO|nr:hypothetical protein [Algoriella xinjiangensis]SFM74716.1 hypothetical protein SAMN05421738_102157 [Algoriella xinjiangensis]VDH15003.1 Uncharacterised protein [Algoriella xinjiangensis]